MLAVILILVTTSAQTRTGDLETNNSWISHFNLIRVSFLDHIDSLSSQIDFDWLTSQFEEPGEPDHRVYDGFAERLSGCDNMGVLVQDVPSGVSDVDASGDEIPATMESVPQVDCRPDYALWAYNDMFTQGGSRLQWRAQSFEPLRGVTPRGAWDGFLIVGTARTRVLKSLGCRC